MVQLPGQLLVPGQRPIPPESQAYDIVRGDIGGVPFVAFDYCTPSRLRAPEVTTAWLVRLPRALPLFPSSEIFRAAARTDLAPEVPNLPDGDEPASTIDPDYAAAIMTDDIVRFTREHLPSWWVDGDVLAAARVGHDATPELVASTAEAVTTLATLLGEPALARFGTPTSSTGYLRPPVG